MGVESACSDRVYLSVFMDPRRASPALVVLCCHPVARTICGLLCFFGVVTACVFVGMVQKVIRLALRITWGALSLRVWNPAVAFVASGIVKATGTKSAILAHTPSVTTLHVDRSIDDGDRLFRCTALLVPCLTNTVSAASPQQLLYINGYPEHFFSQTVSLHWLVRSTKCQLRSCSP